MLTSQFTYTLPSTLIANSPSRVRDRSKLMIVNKDTGKFEHTRFGEIINLLGPNDVIVLNNTKVYPAKIIGTKTPTGGKVEFLLFNQVSPLIWRALFKGKLTKGSTISVNKTVQCYVTKISKNIATLKFEKNIKPILSKFGKTPLPPYIHSNITESSLRQRYQTEFAKVEGSVAAPTAALHFTKNLLKLLQSKGVGIEFVTLHVGLGTFLPIKAENIKSHRMHHEVFTLTRKTANSLNKAKLAGKNIIAVGTTSTRVLETCTDKDGKLVPTKGKTNLFIVPGYKFKFVNSLITNFHLPESTLLALVSAFVSYPNSKNRFKNFNSCIIGKAYKLGVKRKYRFYSFGDAMYIH